MKLDEGFAWACLGGGSFESIPNSIPFGVFGRGLREDYFASGIVAGVELGEHRLGIGGGVLGNNRNMCKTGCFRDGAVGKDADGVSLSACAAHDLF